jgi:hypothetical protein
MTLRELEVLFVVNAKFPYWRAPGMVGMVTLIHIWYCRDHAYRHT